MFSCRCSLWCVCGLCNERFMCRCRGCLVGIGLVEIVLICMLDSCRCVVMVLVIVVVVSSSVSSRVGLLL